MDSKFGLSDIDKAAEQFLQQLNGRNVVAFHGEMGAGKTTFINALCRQLHVTDAVSSPTFSIINQYKTTTASTVYHLDLYRIKSEEEALMAGVEDCYFSGNICFVEWPEKAASLLPENTLHCFLSVAANNERKLKIKL